MALDSISRPVLLAGALGVALGAAALSNAFDSGDDVYRDHDDDERRGGISLNYDGDYGEPKARDHADFKDIRIKGGVALRINNGDFKVMVAVEDDDQEHVTTSVEGDTLVIDVEEDKWDDRDVLVTISMPLFEGLDVRGAVDADIRGIESDLVKIDLRGAGNIELDGRCDTLIIEMRGAGNVEADDLECNDVDVALRGAGNAEVHANDKLKAELAGIGNIDVYGKPKVVDKNVGGFGQIDIH